MRADDVQRVPHCDEIECIIEATGHPIAGVRHALAAIDGGKHLVMVMSKPTSCAARFWRRGPGPRTSSTAWPMATSQP